MMPSRRNPLGASFACLAISYLLLVSLCAPAVGTRAAAAPSTAAARQTAGQPRARAGELLVRFRAGTSEQEKDSAVGSKGTRGGRQLRGGSGVEKIELADGQAPEAAASALRAAPAVEFAEPNFLVSSEQVSVSDPRFGEQWALANTGQNGGTAGSDIGAQKAWQSVTGSQQTVVAVIDSGIDFTHPDLVNNIWANAAERADGRDNDRDGFADDVNGWDWITDGGVITDGQGHGTAVAGVIAAEGNNGAGVSGVMWRASLLSLRVLDNTGTGDVAAAVEAIDYAAAHGAQVVNISWGTDGESLALRDAIARAAAKGVLVVCSAGNSGRNIDGAPYYPASFDLPNLVAVAASDNVDHLTTWSNWGSRSVAVAAPGGDILTTAPGGGYRAVSGTSVAAPVVTGIAALVRTLRPGLSAAQVRAAVVGGARRLEGLAGVVSAGGVASAPGALSSAASASPGGGSGSGNGQGNGGGNNGGGSTQGPGSPGLSKPPPAERGSGGRGPGGGFDVAPSLPSKAAPPGFGNQEEFRRRPQAEVRAAGAVHSDNVLPVCDTSCGGTAPPDAGGSDPRYASARAKPENRTGAARPTSVVGAGEDAGSMNVNWGMPLVQLAGRAGLDLGIGLYYNSLVWTKQGGGIMFNADGGFPGPGFHLGFPTLEPVYNDQYVNNVPSYMLVTPTGGRVVMRQVGATNNYESTDGNYTYLVANYGVNPTSYVYTTDGTRLSFTYNGEKWLCTRIQDRNGNYITINYGLINNNGSLGRPTSVVDTLGRTVAFNYDGQYYLTSITQQWRRETAAGAVTETHTWANFSYDTLAVQTNFPGLTVHGPSSTQSVPVLKRVGLPDGTAYAFDYTSWGQVYRISRLAPDGHTLARTSYNLPADATAAQSDCPRFSERRDWAEYWNGDNDRVISPAEESVTGYSVAQNIPWQMPDGSSHTGTLTQVSSPAYTDKDGAVRRVIQNVYSHSTGWDAGLPVREETFDRNEGANQNTLVRWVTTAWTQDDTSLTYPKNPRVAETNVYDPYGNQRRTTVSYTTVYGISLPGEVAEYRVASGAATLLRRATTEYRWDGWWIDRRVIGRVYMRKVFDGAGALVSKVSYGYDFEGDFWFRDTPAPATQHDRANYGPSYVYGRGNVSSILRWDVTDPENSAKWSEVKLRYNSTGSVIWELDPNWHATSYDFSDGFSDGANRNTFAYPTTVTDPDGYPSTAQYNYDLGAVFRGVDPKGAAVKTFYDSAGRVERVTSEANGAYTRYQYDLNWGQTRTNSSVNAVADDSYTNTIRDGAGQVRVFVASHAGSAGGYRAAQTVYDALGRAVSRTNMTEITADGAPTGDDPAYQWTQQYYDWKGRPTLTTFPIVAGQQTSNTTEMSYSGCGCAGGEVTTVRDERGRRRKLYADTLGRLAKVEELNWGQSVYSTTDYAYNALDQITNVNQAGQTRTFEYDGHGRLYRRTTPEQGATTYAYNADDTVESVTDARGARTHFDYNGRHLPYNISYHLSGVVAGQNVAQTPNVWIEYDAAGNRTSMDDGPGRVEYHYDALSRMDWERRTFDGVWGPDGGAFRISYEYNLAGALKRVTNPWGAQVAYNYDPDGRVAEVKGTDAAGNATYAGVPTYAEAIRYRAFGGLRSASYGDTSSLSTAYDARLRPVAWDVAKASGGVLGYDYSYDKMGENSFRVTYARSRYDQTLNRSYDYDHVGRLWVSHTGSEADGHAGVAPWPSQPTGPYAQQYGYDVWGNITWRAGWGGENPSYTAGYTNNRRGGLSYDLAGNVTWDGEQSYQYDATGQQTSASGTSLQQAYDGDALRAGKVEGGVTTYYVLSSVLGGQVIAEVRYNPSWGWYWDRGYVYGAGGLLAVQAGGVYWAHQDPVTKGQRLTDAAGNVTSGIELDPWGGETNRSFNSAFQPRKYTSYERDGNSSDEAMFRRYNRWWGRFDQPDPWDGSYDLADPQSFNRYAYTQSDPVNFTDPTGLTMENPGFIPPYQNGWNQTTNPTLSFLNGAMRDFIRDYNWYAREAKGGVEIFGFFSYLSFGQDRRQNPRPAPLPTPTPKPTPDRSQQKQFDECAKRAWSTYRRRYVTSTGKAALGGVGIGLGVVGLGRIGTTIGGLSSGLQAVGRALSQTSMVNKNTFTAVSGWLGGSMGWDAVHEGAAIERQLSSDLKDCEKQSPNANHSLTFLNF